MYTYVTNIILKFSMVRRFFFPKHTFMKVCLHINVENIVGVMQSLNKFIL